MLWRTFDLLVYMGAPTVNYESHTPTSVRRKDYAEVARRFIPTELAARARYEGVCSITAYWNITQNYPRPPQNAWDVRAGFTDNANNKTRADVLRQLEGKSFMYHDDFGLNHHLKSVIRELFPTKSRFERREKR
jgi:hypothetical protein